MICRYNDYMYTGLMRSGAARAGMLAGVLAASWLFLLAIAQAGAQAGWVINQFHSDIAIQADGSVLVSETAAVDFAGLEKHGIYRDLPVVYWRESGEEVYTRISQVEVLQDGAKAQFEITRNSANMRIRIGDANQTISGAHEYVISYRVLGVLQAFEGFDEFNWNVTGNEWEAPIERASANVTVPAEILQAACYEGEPGSSTPCAVIDAAAGLVHVESENLAPGEGLTAAVGYAAGIVPIVTVARPPSPADIIFSPITFGVGIIVFLAGAGWIVYRWWRYGRDRFWQRAHLPGERSDRAGKDLSEGILPLFFRQSISVEYEPPDGLRPAEIGVLMDERADALDVSATIVDLASRGYMTITEVPKKWIFGSADYTFVRTDKADDDLLNYERELLTRLFDGGKETKLSDLKNTFYKDLAQVKKLLYEEVAGKGLFAGSPDTVRQLSAAKGIGLLVLGVVCVVGAVMWLSNVQTVYAAQQVMAGAGGGLAGTAAVMILFSRVMPRKTGYGRELYERSRGYELFVSGTEKYRARFYEDKGLFAEVLSYAIMFGVTDKLAKAFKDMGIEPTEPAWFHGAVAFNAARFASSMESFSGSLSSTMASSPSSSSSGGGGFSGGGFGGGGGSW